MDELVSICVLTYNHEKYIQDSLKGFLSQTYSKIELIILDDSSTDRTVELIEAMMPELKEKFVSFSLIKHEKNSGNIPRNCNEMIQKASGEYIKIIAGDDIMLENCIFDLVNAFKENSDASVVYGNSYIVKENYSLGLKIDKSERVFYNRCSGYESDKFFEKIFRKNRIMAPTALIKRSIFIECGLYDEDIPYEDYEYWLRLSSRGKKFYYLDKMLVLYRWGSNSISNVDAGMNNKKLDTNITAVVKTIEKYIHFLPEDEQKTFMKNILNWFMNLSVSASYDEGIKKVKSVAERYDININEFTNQKKTYDINKIKKEALILEQWISKKGGQDSVFKELIDEGCQKVAIFGYTRLGRRLHRELERDGIEVSYVIDRRAKSMLEDIPVFTIDDDLPDIDAIIVTAMGAYNDINEILYSKTKVKIYDLTDFLF